MTDKVPMTKDGAEHLKEVLHEMKTVERRRITAAIAEARAHGDLSENAEYHAAREQQGILEAKIRDAEHKLSHAQIIDVTTMQNNGKVIFGSTVHLVNLDNDEEVVYQIVGEDEADLNHGKISVTSPIARALIGKTEEDEVEVNAPGGVIEYEVIKVEYV